MNLRQSVLSAGLLLGALASSLSNAGETTGVVPPLPRSSGVLLHVTSLPSRFGTGDLGPSAYKWINILSEKKQSWWQVLPINIPDSSGSPYASPSTFAGNTNLISPDMLVTDGLLSADDLVLTEEFNADRTENGRVIPLKTKLLHIAFENFKAGKGNAQLAAKFTAFQAAKASWLDDTALFFAIAAKEGTNAWLKWDAKLAQRNPEALASFKAEPANAQEIEFFKFTQFLFTRQWGALKNYAHSKGVKMIGDIPIYIALDSADAWANPESFQLDAEHRPIAVAGVPPDYFSATGQLWGNPLYNWDHMAEDGFSWWIARFKNAFDMYDRVRVDHFIGFYRYWAVPYGQTTAINGQWKRSRGEELFTRMQQVFPEMPMIAEDLGAVSPEIVGLRDKFGFPGMKVSLLAFLSDENDPNFLNKYTTENSVIYTGTHDNNTTVGWYHDLQSGSSESRMVERYVGLNRPEINWFMIETVMNASSNLAIVPLQDILGLDGSARMNHPGTLSDKNWSWRFSWNQLEPAALDRFAQVTQQSGRVLNH